MFFKTKVKNFEKRFSKWSSNKKIEGVKGIHWNGNEMQIIIGQEVPKVKEEITNIIYRENDAIAKNSQDKANLVNRIIKVFPGVGVPLIPILLGAGVFSLIMMLLMMSGVMPNITLVKENEDLAKNIYYIFNPNLNILFVIIFVISKSSTIWLGIGTCVSAAIYFKWNFVLAFAIGMTICSPILWGNGGPAMLGQQYDPETYIEGWVLFRFAEVSNPMIQRILQINVTPMQAKIGVLLLTIYTAKIFDDWIKKWMPTSIDFICRNLMILTFIPFIAFFIYGPIWNIFEGIFGLFVLLVTKFPLGIGMGLLSGIHQVTVVFGLHQVIGVVFNVDTMTHGGVARLTISSAIGTWAQLAALLGVIIVTSDKRLKKDGTQMFMVGAIAGITEPMLYGVNFPKKRPLYAGMIGGFAGGLIISWTNVTLRGVSAWGGLYSFIAFFSPPIGIQPSILEQEGCLSNVMNGLMFILASAVAFGVAIVVSMLIYKERVSEKTLINKMFNDSIKLLKIEQKILTLKKQQKIELINSGEIKELKSKLKNVIENVEEKSIKKQERSILKSDGAKFDIDLFLKKQEKQTLKLSKKGKHFMKKGQYDKAKEIALKISSLNDFNKLQFLESKAVLAKSKVDIHELEERYQNIENKVSILVKDFTFTHKELSEIDFTPIYKNAVESLLIDYNYKEEYSFKPIEVHINEKNNELAKIKRDLKNERRLKKLKVNKSKS
ncbi:hypothetical protein CG007_00085 [Mesoplasma entomophilum]|nr:hypothetical protein CG007_00085 [Mesoplasma entomophilum]